MGIESVTAALALMEEVTGLKNCLSANYFELPRHLALRVASSCTALENEGRLRQSLSPPILEVPQAFGVMLAAALSEAESVGDERALLILRQHYLDFLPSLRVDQELRSGGQEERILHRPLDWQKLPVLVAALARLEVLFRRAYSSYGNVESLPADFFFGAASHSELLQTCSTLFELFTRTYYGRYLPLLSGFPPDLLRLDALVKTDEAGSLEAVIQEYLTSSIMHEFSHGPKSRLALLSPYLDECLASYIGVLCHEQMAFPMATAECEKEIAESRKAVRALYATPWLMQVGQALARVVGLEPLLQAYVGLCGWEDVLPTGLLRAAVSLGWQEYLERRAPHFLSSNFAPQPWLKLLFAAAAGLSLVTSGEPLTPARLQALSWRDIPCAAESDMDAQMVQDALRAMCVRSAQRDGMFLVSMAVPLGAIDIDCEDCEVRTAAHGESAALSFLFPPATAARLLARGIRGYTVTLQSLSACDEVAALIYGETQNHQAPNFSIVRHS